MEKKIYIYIYFFFQPHSIDISNTRLITRDCLNVHTHYVTKFKQRCSILLARPMRR